MHGDVRQYYDSCLGATGFMKHRRHVALLLRAGYAQTKEAPLGCDRAGDENAQPRFKS